MQNSILKKEKKAICVALKPLNEKHELNYFEKAIGTPKEILERSIEIINGLKLTLKNGDFSIKLESQDLSKTIYLDSENLFDENFNIIGKVEDFMNV